MQPQSDSMVTANPESLGITDFVTCVIEGETYRLINKEAQSRLQTLWQQKWGYDELARQCQAVFNRQNELIKSPLVSQHHMVLRQHLSPSICKKIIEEYDKDPSHILSKPILSEAVVAAINPVVEQHLLSYFNSHYHLIWVTVNRVDEEADADVSHRWHCDGGPTNQLKIIIYLNDYQEHGSDTFILSHESTETLKKAGYFLNSINDRKLDIENLCGHYATPYQVEKLTPSTGDTIIFNATQLGHKRVPAQHKGGARYCLNFCFIPSLIPWRQSFQFLPPKTESISFEGFPSRLIDIYELSQMDISSVIEIPYNDGATAEAQFIISYPLIRLMVDTIFSSEHVKQSIYHHFENNDLLGSYGLTWIKFISLIKSLLKKKSTFKTVANSAIEKMVATNELTDFSNNLEDNIKRFDERNSHAHKPVDEYFDINDFITKLNERVSIDKTTPIGSAGDDVSISIAQALQEQGYHYVVTEHLDQYTDLLSEYKTNESEYAVASALYGRIFNAPAIYQLIYYAIKPEAAKNMLVNAEGNFSYICPYREDIFYLTKAAYFSHDKRHRQAVIEVFRSVEVFILTLKDSHGWQLPNGSLMSRQASLNLLPILTYRTLTESDNIQYLKGFYDIIRDFNPKFKLVISVSKGSEGEQAELVSACQKLAENNADIYYID